MDKNLSKKRRCIWCGEDSPDKFKSKAHTIPQSLGGKKICLNVCDECNFYFGNKHDYVVSPETAVKETLNITRYVILNKYNQIGKNKALSRYKSEYFEADFEKRRIKYKNISKEYNTHVAEFGYQFKRGICKIFLEELQRQLGNAYNKEFDLIRNYARYNVGDIPVFYWQLKDGMYVVNEEFLNPEFHFGEFQLKMMNEIKFYEFMFFGHNFALSFSPINNLLFPEYLRRNRYRQVLFHEIREIKNIHNIDIFLNRF